MENRIDPRKGNNIDILLVEDIDTDMKILIRALNKADFSFRVFKVSDGEEALDFLQNKGTYSDKKLSPRPDIILLDIKMPGMDGYTFVKEVKQVEKLRDIPIIVFTTQKDNEEYFKMEGVVDFIVKTMDATDLIERIKFILNEKFRS